MNDKPLSSPARIKEIAARYGFTFRKSLGQNFLINPTVCPRIAELGGASQDSGVLEIGTGFGVLTAELAARAKKVVAIEIDSSLAPVLSETLAGLENVEVIFQDVLKVDLAALLSEEFPGMEVFVCANLPYYITSPILMYLLEQHLPIAAVTVMVQKEAAARLCAPMGSRECSAITFAVRYYSEPKMLFEVSRGSFMPAPNVDSAVIRLDLKKSRPEGVADERAEAFLFRLVKAAFSQRRKTLPNPLCAGLGIPKERIVRAMTLCGISPTARAEALTMEQYILLANTLAEEQS